MTIDEFITVLKPALLFSIIGSEKIVINKNIDDGITIRILSDGKYKCITVSKDEIMNNEPIRVFYFIIGRYLNELNEQCIQKDTVKAIKQYLKDKVIKYV